MVIHFLIGLANLWHRENKFYKDTLHIHTYWTFNVYWDARQRQECPCTFWC